jgi:hypothetical protein
LSNTLNILAWCFAAILFGLILPFSGVHEFNLWPQVNILRGTSPKFIDILSQAHFLRYLLVYPIFIAADIFNLDANKIFSFFGFFMLFFIVKNCTKMVKFYVNNNEIFFLVWFSFIFLVLAMSMNGRIIFAFYGLSYLLVSLHRWERYEHTNLGLFLRIFPALFFCSVSTGTFLACLLGLMFWSIIFVNRSKRRFNVYFVALGVVVSPVATLFLLKNVNFYGGGIGGLFNMLNHGAGKIFYSIDLLSLVLLILIIVHIIFFAMLLLLYLEKYRLLIIFTVTSAFAGLFGYSTLSLGVIPASVLSILFLTSSRRLTSR